MPTRTSQTETPANARAALLVLLAAAGSLFGHGCSLAQTEAGNPPMAKTTSTDSPTTLWQGLTAVPGIRVGHVTLDQRPTGCTVVLATAGAVAAADIRGGAPATRETDLLRPENMVQRVHAIVLSGGSAYGLDSASGVMRFLEERNVGFPVRGTVVPIVVGASLLDLGLGSGETATQVRPDADCGYRAAQIASSAHHSDE